MLGGQRNPDSVHVLTWEALFRSGADPAMPC